MNRMVYRGGNAEIVEKKSRFLGEVLPVDSEEAVLRELERIRKEHYNASHHCFAYVLEGNPPYERASDDGEPQGTAGRPILQVIQGESLLNALVVVTRYFGGTLLGTGGLTRAYSLAAKEALSDAVLLEKREGLRYHICLDYQSFGKLQYMAAQMGLTVEEVTYADQVEVRILSPKETGGIFTSKLTEATAARAVISEPEPLFYGIHEGQVLLLP